MKSVKIWNAGEIGMAYFSYQAETETCKNELQKITN